MKNSMASEFPELLNEWDYERNKCNPCDFSKGSKQKVYWVCSKGHKWKTHIYVRTSGHGCPYCSGKRLCKENSLGTKSPSLLNEWHPIKNLPLTPFNVPCHTSKKVWWQCCNGHEWEASINNRYNRETKCPCCSGKKLCKESSLGVKSPDLLKEWHPTKNLPLTPFEVPCQTSKKVWWICHNGHEWEASINNRFNGTGCPCCVHRKVSTDNCLALNIPDLVSEWHSTKNYPLTPHECTIISKKKVWWQCSCGYEWETTIRNRVNGVASCKICSPPNAIVYNMTIENPELLDEWHPDKNIDISPTEIISPSKTKVWWRCKFGHEWQALVYTRRKGHGCRKCQFRSSKLELRIYTELKYLLSDVSWQDKTYGCEIDILLPGYNIAIEVDGWYWHKDKEKSDANKYQLLKSNNLTLIRIRDARLANSELADFNIFHIKSDSAHSIFKNLLKIIINIISENDSLVEKISECLVSKKYMNGELYKNIKKNLPAPLPEKSVCSNAKLLQEWDRENNSLGPEYYSLGSNSKIYWKCKNNHSWLATISSRASGRGCPYCLGKLPSKENNLGVISPKLADEWHPIKNKEATPYDVTARSKKKAWWLCKKCGYEWLATIGNRFNGTGCPDCSFNKTSLRNNFAVKFPDLLTEWDYEKNIEISPYDYGPASDKKVYWKCKFGHSWETAINKRTKGRGCHYCTGQKVLPEKSLIITHPTIVREWDYGSATKTGPDLPFLSL